MKETKKAEPHTYNSKCGCRDCLSYYREHEVMAMINRANLWFRSNMESLKQDVSDFIKIKKPEVREQKVRMPKSKQSSRKKKT